MMQNKWVIISKLNNRGKKYRASALNPCFITSGRNTELFSNVFDKHILFDVHLIHLNIVIGIEKPFALQILQSDELVGQTPIMIENNNNEQQPLNVLFRWIKHPALQTLHPADYFYCCYYCYATTYYFPFSILYFCSFFSIHSLCSIQGSRRCLSLFSIRYELYEMEFSFTLNAAQSFKSFLFHTYLTNIYLISPLKYPFILWNK